MRISKSQLKRIVGSIIREQVEMMPPSVPAATSWISIDDIERLISDDDRVNKVFWDSVDSGSTAKLMDILPEKLYSDQTIRDKFFSQFGEDEDLLDSELMKWFDANEENIENFLEQELRDSYDPESGDETERIFGSEAGYWRYRMG